jgi:hypothetical protein
MPLDRSRRHRQTCGSAIEPIDPLPDTVLAVDPAWQGRRIDDHGGPMRATPSSTAGCSREPTRLPEIHLSRSPPVPVCSGRGSTVSLYDRCTARDAARRNSARDHASRIVREDRQLVATWFKISTLSCDPNAISNSSALDKSTK